MHVALLPLSLVALSLASTHTQALLTALPCLHPLPLLISLLHPVLSTTVPPTSIAAPRKRCFPPRMTPLSG